MKSRQCEMFSSARHYLRTRRLVQSWGQIYPNFRPLTSGQSLNRDLRNPTYRTVVPSPSSCLYVSPPQRLFAESTPQASGSVVSIPLPLILLIDPDYCQHMPSPTSRAGGHMIITLVRLIYFCYIPGSSVGSCPLSAPNILSRLKKRTNIDT